MPITLVNMIPESMSGETNQDSEPSIAVNPTDPTTIVGTAFTRAPGGGTNAPIFVSTDGGHTWSLRMVVPGNGPVGTRDISVAFAGVSGVLYAGTLNGTTSHLNLLRGSSATAVAPMTLLLDRGSEDQPWVVAGTAAVDGAAQDRVYIGNNDFNQPSGGTATVDVSLDAETLAAPAGFAPHRLEQRGTGGGQDGPPVRLALHTDGTIYAAYESWTSISKPDLHFDVVVTRDDSWASGDSAFDALLDSTDQVAGQRVATDRFARWNDMLGQQRIGADLAIAVDPTDSGSVWIAWCERVGGASGTDWTLYVAQSTDRGQSWSNDVRTITNAKNPALAINADRQVALLYQQLADDRWITNLELTSDGWATDATTLTLHTASATVPTATFQPYLGDYIRILALGTDFYGVFSGNNTPDEANFPNGVAYQRNANWTTHVLLSTDNATPVNISIDPFFFHWWPDATA